MKIIIIGGGIAGLSAATILSDIPDIDVVLYEKESLLGGQSASTYSKTCNIEYSWRVFSYCYHNLMYIFNEKLKILQNFKKLENNCFIEDNKKSDAYLDLEKLIFKIFETSSFFNYYKYTDFLCLTKERIMNQYDINAYEYFDKNPIVQTILGPFLGMEANKVSLSGAIKNIYSVTDTKKFFFTPNSGLITINPTNDSIFDDWERYLIDKGVSIYKNSSIENITIGHNTIKDITINKEIVLGDEFIFACSINTINQLFENKYHSNTLNCMKKMVGDLQLYFTINIYFSKKISSVDCPQEIIVDMPWKPIIQRKTSWSKSVMKKCSLNNKEIKEVWNVGFLDFNKGKYNNKILQECSIDEAIKEGVSQIKGNKYIQDLFTQMNLTFDDIYMGSEHWYQYINDSNGKIISTNPKFSINVNTMKYMPNSYNKDMPSNMNLCGYYVNNTMGGVSMESSCETGLIAGKNIIDKYNFEYNDIFPIKHDNNFLSIYTIPLVYIDKLLYYSNLPSIVTFINSFYLLIVYFLLLFFIIFYILYSIYKIIPLKIINKNIRKFVKNSRMLS